MKNIKVINSWKALILLFAINIPSVTLADEPLIFDDVVEENVNLNDIATNNQINYKYSYNVDLDKVENAHSIAFAQLLTEISKGGTSIEDVNVNIDDFILDEELSDDGIKIIFNEDKVDNELKKQIKIWNGLSEPIISWIVSPIENDNQNLDAETTSSNSAFSLDNSTTHGALSQFLISQSAKEKVQIILPINDLDDLALVTPKDILQHNSTAICKASKRYSSGYALSAFVGVSTDNKDEYFLSYYLYDINNESLMTTGDLIGTKEKISSDFFNKLKSLNLTNKVATNDQKSNQSQAAEKNSKDVKNNNEAKTNNSKLGIVSSGKVVIKITNLDKSNLNKFVRSLYRSGISDLTYVTENGDYLFTLNYPSSLNIVSVLNDNSLISKFADEDFIYEFITKY